MSSHTEFQANVNASNSRTVGRVIGHKGSGTKRITDEVKSLFPGSRCYIRGDRDTCNFLIKTFGVNGDTAIRHAGEMVTAEVNWANGTGACPHPNANYKITFENRLVPHVIGSKGSGLKKVMDRVGRSNGAGCFIVHKQEHNAFLIEAISQDQLQAGRVALADHIERIKAEQGVVVVDLSQPAALDLSQPAARGATRTAKAKGTAKAKAQLAEDTNSFASLAETSDDDEEDDAHSFPATLVAKQPNSIGKSVTQLENYIEPSKTEVTRSDKKKDDGGARSSTTSLSSPWTSGATQLENYIEANSPAGLLRRQNADDGSVSSERRAVLERRSIARKTSPHVVHTDHLGFTCSKARQDTRSHNREFQQAREAVADKLGIDVRYVKDHQTNAYLRDTQVDAEDVVLDQARKSSPFELDMSTSSSEAGIALTVDTPWSTAPSAVTSATGEVYTKKSSSVQAKETAAASKKLAKTNKDPVFVDLAPVELEGFAHAAPNLSRQQSVAAPAFPNLSRPGLKRTLSVGVEHQRPTCSWGSDGEEDDTFNDLPALIEGSAGSDSDEGRFHCALGSNPGNDAYIAAQLEDLEEATHGSMTMAELAAGASDFNQEKTVHWEEC